MVVLMVFANFVCEDIHSCVVTRRQNAKNEHPRDASEGGLEARRSQKIPLSTNNELPMIAIQPLHQDKINLRLRRGEDSRFAFKL